MSAHHVLRPARESDLPDLQALAASVDGGLTTLPNDSKFLENKIVDSVRAFDPRIHKPSGEYYLFVLEACATGDVIGTSGIIACVGGFEPFYSYEIRKEPFSHPPLAIEKEVRVLHLTRSHRGPAEVCSLFLHPRRRASGLGRLLSLGRFMFMRLFPDRFDDEVIAEMRGWLDESGNSPFWDSVGRHFFEKDYTTADFLSGLGNKAFIEDLMPEYPIYLSLLPREVQAVIGRVHRDTEPALKLLLEEGFSKTNEVDIFDAGPILRAALDEIRVVRKTVRSRVTSISTTASGPAVHLIARAQLDFRACLGSVERLNDGSVTLSREVASALEVEPGVSIIWAPLRPAGS